MSSLKLLTEFNKSKRNNTALDVDRPWYVAKYTANIVLVFKGFHCFSVGLFNTFY